MPIFTECLKGNFRLCAKSATELRRMRRGKAGVLLKEILKELRKTKTSKYWALFILKLPERVVAGLVSGLVAALIIHYWLGL